MSLSPAPTTKHKLTDDFEWVVCTHKDKVALMKDQH